MRRFVRSVHHLSRMNHTQAPPQKPVIAIVGATGTGKSELAVSLARRLNGEIINGDAMQLYAGLPVITNKIPVEERHGVPHHLLGCIGLQEQPWVVGTFVHEGVRVIEEVLARGKLPILVGGTHYYTQALLFDGRLAETKGAVADSEETEGAKEKVGRHAMLDLPTENLLQELQKVDPVMARRWHPNDRRKIQRSLELYLKTGKTASDIYAKQRTERVSESDLDSREGLEQETKASMRFPTLLLWVHSNTEALRNRLDERVDRMLASGLLDEVHALRSHALSEEESGRHFDETRGIWVSIGYKEFKNYAAALQRNDVNEADLRKMKTEAIEKTQAATRQYAKRQIRWIRIKLLNALADALASEHLFVLDSSDVSSFEVDVVEPAERLTRQFLEAAPLPRPDSLSSMAAEVLQPKRDYDLSATPERWIRQHCELCGVTSVTSDQWLQHTKSRAHRKLTSKRKTADGRKNSLSVDDHIGDG